MGRNTLNCSLVVLGSLCSSCKTRQSALFICQEAAASVRGRENELRLPQSHRLIFSLYFQSYAFGRELMGTGLSAEQKPSTTDQTCHHVQRELCACERQSVLL